MKAPATPAKDKAIADAAATAAAAAEAQKKADAERKAKEKADKEAAKAKEKADREAKRLAEKEQREADKAAAKVKADAEKAAKAEATAKAKADKEAAKAAEKEAAAKQREANKMPEQNGIRRPKPETICGHVWALADAISKQLGQPAPIQYMLQHGRDKGYDDHTIKTQYARWKKYNNVSGRVNIPLVNITVA